jgi:hypothetical protein
MPIIAIEEDYDEVSRILNDVPNVKSFATISIETVPKEPEDDYCRAGKYELEQEKHGNDFCALHNVASLSNPPSDQLNVLLDNTNPSNASQLVVKDEDASEGGDSNAGVDSLGSTFELCSITSYADPLSLSISRSRRSLDRSIGNSTSSRKRYVVIRKASSGHLQLNKSIGSSTSSNRNRKVRCSSINQSTYSTGSKKLTEVIVVPKTESIDKKYFVDYSREIGRGTQTIVRKCIERSTGNRFAVKSVRRADIDEYEHMRTEANLLTALNHPSIIQIYDTFEDDKYLHMVVEICKGGELYDYIVKPSRKDGKKVINCPSEDVAAVIVRRVVDAIAYLHDHNIVHRDLKVSSKGLCLSTQLAGVMIVGFPTFVPHFVLTFVPQNSSKTSSSKRNPTPRTRKA